MRLGLMGGTFDPPHFGHLFMAEAARVQHCLDKVFFFPNRVPPHRQGKTAHAQAALRWEMTLAAIESNPHFEASRVELERSGPSFTIDTVRHFAGDGDEVYFLIGGDSLQDLPTWHASEELLNECHFIVAPRPGCDAQKAKAALPPNQQQKVLLLNAPALEISSTEIRRRTACNLSIRYLLPEAVERIIASRHLYV